MTKEELQRALECAERCDHIDGALAWSDVVDSLKAALEAKDEPVQVSPLQFVEMVMEKEDCIGKPIIWAEWPNKEKAND